MDQSDNVDNTLGGVAIIGMVGRFPGASDLETYWRNIRQGVETVTHFQDERLAKTGIPPGVLKHPAYVKARGIVDDIDMFDPAFFGYSARDAVVMDPQQRLFLQCCWEGLETSGYDPRAYQGLIGVYGGATASSYQPMVWANLEGLKVDGMSAAIGNELSFLTTRVVVQARPERPKLPGPDGMLDLARGGPPGLPGSAECRVRHGARRGRVVPCAAGNRLRVPGGGHPFARRPVPSVRCDRKRDSVQQRTWSGCPQAAR